MCCWSRASLLLLEKREDLDEVAGLAVAAFKHRLGVPQANKRSAKQ